MRDLINSRSRQVQILKIMLKKGDNTVAIVVARRLSIASGTYLLSEDLLVATKNLQVKMQNSLSVGDYFKNYDLFWVSDF